VHLFFRTNTTRFVVLFRSRVFFWLSTITFFLRAPLLLFHATPNLAGLSPFLLATSLALLQSRNSPLGCLNTYTRSYVASFGRFAPGIHKLGPSFIYRHRLFPDSRVFPPSTRGFHEFLVECMIRVCLLVRGSLHQNCLSVRDGLAIFTRVNGLVSPTPSERKFICFADQ